MLIVKWNRRKLFRRGFDSMPHFKVAPIKPMINHDDLEKIDVRVGTIVLVEGVVGSDSLVELIVDFDDRNRTILVGMKKERENPKKIKGKQALFVVNMTPKKMMGQLSEGMLFDIGYLDGIKPTLTVPEYQVPSGSPAG